MQEVRIKLGILQLWTDAEKAQPSGTYFSSKNFWWTFTTFIKLKVCQIRAILDRWLSGWMIWANLFYRNFRFSLTKSIKIWKQCSDGNNWMLWDSYHRCWRFNSREFQVFVAVWGVEKGQNQSCSRGGGLSTLSTPMNQTHTLRQRVIICSKI